MTTGILNGYIQKEWLAHPNQGIPGLLTFLNEPHDYINCPIESDFIGFGMPCIKGTVQTDRVNSWNSNTSPYNLAAFPAGGTAAQIVGVLAYHTAGRVGPNPVMTGDEPNIQSGLYQYEAGTLVRLGFMHVLNWADTTEDATVYVVTNATNSLNAPVGSFVTTDLAGAAVEVPQIRWHSSDLHSMNNTSVVKINFMYGTRA